MTNRPKITIMTRPPGMGKTPLILKRKEVGVLATPVLSSAYRAYDGSLIEIVPPSKYDEVAMGFLEGIYGVDTESDMRTHALRIIQIYNGHTTYIFHVDALTLAETNGLMKFLRSKNRIKVGVDFDGDVYKIKKHVGHLKFSTPEEKNRRNKFNVNGAIDIQSICRVYGETIFSLDKLSDKYVEDFIGNPSKLGNYNPPTVEQYIYAANDAILSLKIFKALMEKSPCQRWLSRNQEESIDSYDAIADSIIPMIIADTPKSILETIDHLVNEMRFWPSVYSKADRIQKSWSLLRRMASENCFDLFDPKSDAIWIKPLKPNKIKPIPDLSDAIPVQLPKSEVNVLDQLLLQGRIKSRHKKRKNGPISESKSPDRSNV